MLELPILTVRLQVCSEDWQHMTPTAQGRHCAHCNREVVDFTNGTATDLAAARAASSDGHLCGRFRQSQLAATPRPQLRPRLRRFLVALVLVCGLGLSGREAWAQVRAGSKAAPSKAVKKSVLSKDLKPLPETPELLDLPANTIKEKVAEDQIIIGKPYSYVGELPDYPGGIAKALQFVAQNIRYPAGATESGKVFVNFRVLKTGQLDGIRIMKGLEPLLDAEALRVFRLMPAWIPARRDGKPVDSSFTLPATFVATDTSVPPKKGRK